MENIIVYILIVIAFIGPIFGIILGFVVAGSKKRNELERAKIIKKLSDDDAPYAIWICKIASNEKDFRKFAMIRAVLIAIPFAMWEVFLIYQMIKYAVDVRIIC